MRTTGGLVILIGVLAAACGKQEDGGTTSAQPESKPADAAAAAPAPAPAPATADAGTAQAVPPADGPPQHVAATPVDRGLTSAPRGLYEVLVKPGKYTLRNKDGETLTVEVTDVRTLHGARVADLEWEPEEKSSGMPSNAILTAKGLLLNRYIHDKAATDQDLAKEFAGKPDYADPPRLDAKGEHHARLVDGMVCLGYQDMSGECGDESCAWRVCLRPGEIAGADGNWAERNQPVEYTAPAKDPPGKLKGVKLAWTASSQLSSTEVWQFEPAGLTDGTLVTSWQVGKGKGVGEWAEVKLDRPARLDAIEIANGYQLVDNQGKLGDLFINNARPRTLTISLDGKPAAIVDLPEKQRGFVRVELGGRTATTLRLTIDAVWPGKKWQDVAINEVVLFGK